MITFATDALIPELKRLWSTCFDDSDAYVDLYFRHRYRAENTLVNVSMGVPVAMLTMLPVIATCPGMEIPARYLFAVATRPDRRGKGLATELLDHAHDWMKDQGIGLSMLVPGSPGLFGFYRRHRYKSIFNLQHARYEAPPYRTTSGKYLATVPSQLSSLAALRNRFFKNSRLFVSWDESALSYIDMECALLGGSVLTFKHETMEVGYAVCYRIHDGIVAKELVIEDSDFELAVGALQRFYHGQRLEVRLCADHPTRTCGSPVPFGMGRWHDRELEDAFITWTGGAPYLSHALD